jgi:DNA-binding MarR family transcriptional regulator
VSALAARDRGIEAVGAELGERLPGIASRLSKGLRQAHDPIGLRPGEFPVLSFLLRRPGATVSELAQAEGVRTPSMTAILAQMEAGGLISKAGDRSDRRCVRVGLTARGDELARAAVAARKAWFEARLARLSRAQIVALDRAMEALERLTEVEP